MNIGSLTRRLARQGSSETLFLNPGFLNRAWLAALFVIVAHQFRWEWLRFLTSETILRISALVGMTTARISFDTIELQGQAFTFVVACTFVDVCAGTVPLVWKLKTPVLENILWSTYAFVALLVFNILRLETGHILYVHRVPWILAHDIFGGFAYFAVWLTIWSHRGWQVRRAS